MNTKHDCNILDSKLVTVAGDYEIKGLKCDSKNGKAVHQTINHVRDVRLRL